VSRALLGRAALVLATAIAASPACAPRSDATPGAASPRAGSWASTEAASDVRKLTVLVAAPAPHDLQKLFETLARGRTDELGAFYRASAAGGFGSGVVLVRRTGRGTRPFVVTNRHVVELADRAFVALETGARIPVDVLFADDRYDLAVLDFDGEGPAPFDRGFAFEPATPKDGQVVVATGYPALGDSPSFQTAKGYVSNHLVELSEGGVPLAHIQHTAPIDPGSSGGPLTTESGTLLGVNAFKAVGRENVAFAIPASAVQEVVERALDVEAHRASVDWRRATLTDACLGFVAALATATNGSDADPIDRMISTDMTAAVGPESYAMLAGDDEAMQTLFGHNPIGALRRAAAKRVRAEVAAAGGVHSLEVCATPDTGDWQAVGSADAVRFGLRMHGGGMRVVKLGWEQGRWKVDAFEMRPAAPPPAAPHDAHASTKKAAKR
jgi:serine protease Do